MLYHYHFAISLFCSLNVNDNKIQLTLSKTAMLVEGTNRCPWKIR